MRKCSDSRFPKWITDVPFRIKFNHSNPYAFGREFQTILFERFYFLRSMRFLNTYKMLLVHSKAVIRPANEMHWIQTKHSTNFGMMIDNRYSLHDQQLLDWKHFFWNSNNLNLDGFANMEWMDGWNGGRKRSGVVRLNRSIRKYKY